jgi:hypothetical protein
MARTNEVPLSAFAIPEADVDMGTTFKIINLENPEDPQDAATMAYVDDQVAAPRIRAVQIKTATAALTDEEVLGGLVVLETSTDNQVLTLPEAASSNEGADLFVSFQPTVPADAAALVCTDGFHGGGASFDTLSLAPNEGCHVYSDGTNWYLVGAGPGCTLS